jgi:phosphoribosylformimino-5-aminoimidazole carboxamide ribotide isomerase
LVQDGDFNTLMRTLQDDYKFSSCYIADLDAIEYKSTANLPLIKGYRQQPGAMRLLVDAGLTEAAEVPFLLQQGIDQLAVGTETLLSLDELRNMLVLLGPGCLFLSVDTKDGYLLSPNPLLAELEPPELIRRAVLLGIEDILLLQLSRVGTGGGLDKKLIVTCLKTLVAVNPHASLWVGGGIASLNDLRWLKQAGVGGAIISSLLHQGAIGPSFITERNQQ